MSVSLQLVPPDENARAHLRAAAIERALSRFPAGAQPRLRAFVREHAWTADLVVSFPALAAAIALGPKNAARDAAFAAVLAGAPLSRIAAITKTALWLRNVPPNAFAKPAPKLPDDAEFRRSIVNHFPRSWKYAPVWFDAITLAHDIADSEIALWFAREAPRVVKRFSHTRMVRNQNQRLVALFAWMSKHQHVEAKDGLTLWNDAMQWAAAQRAALDWSNAALLDMFLGDGVLDAWFEYARIGEYEFTPLLTAAQIRAEAAAMQNCVRTYGYDIASDERRLWSVRKCGVRVATLSLKASHGFMPMIDELSGPSNKRVDDEVVGMVRRWMSNQDPHATSQRSYKEAAFDQRRWRDLWRPYWIAKKRIPAWLPLRGDETAMYAL